MKRMEMENKIAGYNVSVLDDSGSSKRNEKKREKKTVFKLKINKTPKNLRDIYISIGVQKQLKQRHFSYVLCFY